MTHVWITQCLCPQRHCIVAAAGEAEDQADAEEAVDKPLRLKVAAMLKSEAVNPWCSMCKARLETWRYETRRTRFRSMEEAEPALRQEEAAQAVTRSVWGIA
jgi:hypothetical protein